MESNNYETGNILSRVYSKIREAYFNYQSKRLEKTQERIVEQSIDYSLANHAIRGCLQGDIERFFEGDRLKKKAFNKRKSLKKKESRLINSLRNFEKKV